MSDWTAQHSWVIDKNGARCQRCRAPFASVEASNPCRGDDLRVVSEEHIHQLNKWLRR